MVSRSLKVRTLSLVLFCAALIAATSHAPAPPSVGFAQYVIFGDEADLIAAYKAVPNLGVPAAHNATNVNSRLSIVASADGVHVYLDEWEDGYDFNPALPYTTADAKWDTATGGSGEQGGALNRGQVLTLFDSTTFVAGSQGIDAGDRLFITGAPVAVVRTIWPDDPGSFVAGSWELFPIEGWQDSYVVPVGRDMRYPALDVSGDPYTPFEYSFLFIRGYENNTRVIVTDPISGVLSNTVITEMQNIYVPNVRMGTTIVAQDASNPSISRRVQAGIMTSVNENVDMNYYTLTPSEFLGNEYYCPVPTQTMATGQPDAGNAVLHVAYVYSFQPNTTVNFQTSSGTQTTVLSAAGSVARFVMPQIGQTTTTGTNAARIFTNNPTDKIWVIMSGDDENDTVDWGYQALNESYLRDEYYLPYAPANPFYVTPVNDNTQFFVDFNNDNVPEVTFTLNMLSFRMVYDPDTDLTGTHVWANGPFAMVYGQDNTQQSPGEPSPDYDFGYTVLPLNWFDPMLSIDQTANPDTLPGGGGETQITLVVSSGGYPMVFNVDIFDQLPVGWAYVPGTTSIVYSDGTPTGGANPTIGGPGNRNLSWELDHNMPANTTITITYTAQTTGGQAGGVNQFNGSAYGTSLVNEADTNNFFFRPTDFAQVIIPSAPQLNLTLSSNGMGKLPGENITYTILVTNIGVATASNTTVTDAVPVGTTYVPGTTTVLGPQHTHSDLLNAVSYSNSDGTHGWLGAWTEAGDDGTSQSPTSGHTQILSDGGSNRIRMRSTNRSLTRSANLSGYSNATLSYSYRRTGLDDSDDWCEVQISTNGTTWTPLARYAGPNNDTNYQTASHNLTAGQITANTRIRLQTSGNLGSNSDQIFFDDITLSKQRTVAGSPTTVATGYELRPQESMTIQFQVKIDPLLSPDIFEIPDHAQAVCTQVPTPVMDTVIDMVSVCIGFPSLDPADGRSVSVAGVNLNTLAAEESHFFINVLSATPTFRIDIFDGDTGRNPLDAMNWQQGFWDYGTAQLRYALYADPMKTGTTAPANLVGMWMGNSPNTLSGSGAGTTWSCDSDIMPDNDWWRLTLTPSAAAQGPSGHYFYRLDVNFASIPGSEDTWSNFKIRTTGNSISAAPGILSFSAPILTLQDYAVIYPESVSYQEPGPTTYDGSWEFIVRRASTSTQFVVWNGDLDCGNSDGSIVDTDDPNTPVGIPSFSTSMATRPEGTAGMGAPPDNTNSTFRRVDPEVRLRVIDPVGVQYMDMNPSGNLEWERFVIKTVADGDQDLMAASLPAGDYTVMLEGVDLTNLTFLYFDEEISVCGAPPLQPFIAQIGGTVNATKSSANQMETGGFGTERGLGTGSSRPDSGSIQLTERLPLRAISVRLQGTDDLGRGVDRTLETDWDGRYLFDSLAPGTYSVTVDMADEDMPAGLSGRTPLQQTITVGLDGTLRTANFGFTAPRGSTGPLQTAVPQ